MADELPAELLDRLAHAKLEALKELAYGASHEINNPLANIAARAQTLLPGETDPERRRALVAIHRQALRAHEMISDLMLFARPPKLQIAPCDLNELVRRSIDAHGPLAEERNIEIAFVCAGDSYVSANADITQLAVAMNALLINAIEAIGANGRVDVRVEEQQEGDFRFAVITVADDGPGISDHVRAHMFEPFFSGREAGRGLGFGLSKCWRIVTDHGGRVVVHQSAGRGAVIAIWLPQT